MTTVLFTEKSIERLQKIVSSATMMTGASYISSLLLTSARTPRTINDGIHTITFNAMLATCKCTPKGKYTQYSGSTIRTIGRQEVKVGRMVRSVLIEEMGYELTDAQIEDFVNTMRVTMLPSDGGAEYEFVLVDGDDIRKYYSYEYYAREQYEGCGTLWNSCMRNGEEEWFDIYTGNENCSMLLQVLPKKDASGNYKVLSRAIVWKTKDGITLMDRVYTVKDEFFAAMRQYAIDNGWHYKHRNSSDSERHIVNPNGEMEKLKVVVETGLKRLVKFPYMDTMKYYDLESGLLSNYALSSRPYMLQETCGGYSSHTHFQLCEVSQEYTFPENIMTLGNLSRMPGAKVDGEYGTYALCGFEVDGTRYYQYLLDDETELTAVGSIPIWKGLLNEKLMHPILNLKIKGRDAYFSLIDMYGHTYACTNNGIRRYSVNLSRDESAVYGFELPEEVKKCMGNETFEDVLCNKPARRLMQMIIPALYDSGFPIFGLGKRLERRSFDLIDDDGDEEYRF